MDIKKVIVKDSKVFGLLIEDGELTYPITIRGLHNPQILDTLLESGWILKDTKFDIVKDGLTLKDLPRVHYSSLNVTPIQEQDMQDIEAVLYSHADLLSKIPAGGRSYINFRQSINKIKTRQELFEFLTLIETNKTIDLGMSNYMPLNSFVAPSALFTAEEYLSPDNYRWVKIIESRRELSVAKLKQLVIAFKALGLPDDYKEKDLVDYYFSWGICGIRCDVYDKVISSLGKLLTSKSFFSAENDYVITAKELTYVTHNGDVIRSERTKAQQWKVPEDQLTNALEELKVLGEDYIEPVYIETPIQLQHTRLSAENGVVIDYTKQELRIATPLGKHYAPTLRVKLFSTSVDEIPPKFLCLNNKTEKDLYTYIVLKGLADEIAQRSRVNYDVSSYKAYTSRSAGPNLAVNCLLSDTATQDMMVDILAEDSEELAMTFKSHCDANLINGQIKRYTSGEMLEGSVEHKLYDTLVPMIVKGELSSDGITRSIASDSNAINNNDYYVKLALAHDILGIPLEDIVKQVSQVTDKTPFIDFVDSVGYKVRLSIKPASRALYAYNLERASIDYNQAKDARLLVYITTAWREAGGKLSKKRHIGFSGKCLDFRKNSQLNAIRDSIIQKMFGIYYEYTGNLEDAKQASVRIFPKIVFELIIKGEYKLGEKFNNQTITVNAFDLAYLRECATDVHDSTTAICENIYDSTGVCYAQVVNAIVTPTLIIPYKGYSVKEVFGFDMWANTNGFPEVAQGFFEAGNIPSPDFHGVAPIYSYVCLPRQEFFRTMGAKLIKINQDPEFDNYGLAVYFREALEYRANYDKNRELGSVPHLAETLYPYFYSTEEDEETYARPESEQGNRHVWDKGTPRTLTYESVLKENPDFSTLVTGLANEDEVDTALTTYGFFKFNGVSMKYIELSLNSLEQFTIEDLKVEELFKGEYINPIKEGARDFLAGDFRYDVNQIERLYLEDKYRIRKIHSRLYICESINGFLYEARL